MDFLINRTSQRRASPTSLALQQTTGETEDKMKLWLDANQGDNENGQAFGYIGTNETDADGNDYCGWFFDWPEDMAPTAEAREAVLGSMDLDETCRHLQPIPLDEAREALERYLDRKFDLQESA